MSPDHRPLNGSLGSSLGPGPGRFLTIRANSSARPGPGDPGRSAGVAALRPGQSSWHIACPRTPPQNRQQTEVQSSPPAPRARVHQTQVLIGPVCPWPQRHKRGEQCQASMHHTGTEAVTHHSQKTVKADVANESLYHYLTCRRPPLCGSSRDTVPTWQPRGMA